MDNLERSQMEELVGEIRKGLLSWYGFRPDGRILYIQKENDDLVPMLEGASLEITTVPMELTMTDKWQKEHSGEFDYIIAVEILETRTDPLEILKLWKGLLKSDGTLLFGMNNRFGIRYFCGDRDPYTERNFDGIEGYQRAYAKKEDRFEGRCYSKEEMREMLAQAGWKRVQFFSVFSDLDNPGLIYGEDYLPNEDLTNRIFPVYHYPNSVFLEEECLYGGLIKNGMFHQMANAYLVECPLKGECCNVSHVTSSMERGREKAVFTIIYKSGIVEKRAPYEEGGVRLLSLLEHGKDLEAHGIRVVEARVEDGVCRMPFVEGETGQLYLKRLLQTDRDKFLEEMDHFRDLILSSSEIVRPDQGDGEGAVLKKGYLDMVPLNSFHMDGTFVFYDQEFCEENYPANEIIWRMVATFYAGAAEAGKLVFREELLERYGLMEKLGKWQRMEWDFLAKLRKEKELRPYHERCRRNHEIININRQRMNYGAEEYERLFVDVFRNADTRKLILFGSGVFAKQFLSLYQAAYPVYAIIDNNEEKWGEELEGIRIQPPEFLKELQSGEYKVLICIKNYLSVMKQLDKLGVSEYAIYDPGKDYPRRQRPALQGQQDEKREKKKYHTGYIAGVFDLFHVGHLNMFKRAKEQCEYLIVGVVTDEGVRKFKKTEPFIPFEERAEMVRSCRYVDEVAEIPLNCGGTKDAWKLHHFDCQFSGSDYEDNPDWLREKAFLEKHGAEMVFFPYTKGTSSTKIKRLIEKRTREMDGQ
jgi:cytidyltransferase-like protein